MYLSIVIAEKYVEVSKYIENALTVLMTQDLMYNMSC